MGEDKLKTRRDCVPAPGVESVFRCYSTTCQAIWRRGGPDKDRMGLGWWVGARSKCDSQLKACLLLLAVSEARGKTGPGGVQGPLGHLEPH